MYSFFAQPLTSCECEHAISLLKISLFIDEVVTEELWLFNGGIGGRRRRGRQRVRWLDGITDSIDMSLSELRGVGDGQGGLACWDSRGRRESDMTEQLN